MQNVEDKYVQYEASKPNSKSTKSPDQKLYSWKMEENYDQQT